MLLGRKANITRVSEWKVGETVLTDSNQIADTLNKHFWEIRLKIGESVEPTQVSPELYVTPSSSHFTINATLSSTTHSLLSELSVTKASGFC